ncbi:MAG: prolyl oligopeptidase family serine peptidase, partial [Bacteroidota bacterium]
MKRVMLRWFWFWVFGLFIVDAKSQSITLEDYKRAVSFRYYNFDNKTIFNLNPSINWFEDGSGIYFHEFSEEGKKYRTVDFEDFVLKDLFDHQRMANSLSTTLDKEIDKNKIGISDVEKEGNHVLKFKFEGKPFKVDLESYAIDTLKIEDEPEVQENEEISPDGKWIAFAKNYNLYIRSAVSGEEFALTTDGEKDNEYTNSYGWFDKMEGENGDRPTNFFVSWSPDSKWIYTHQLNTQNAEKMYLLDWSKDHLFKPKLLSYYRGSPGDTSMVMVRPVVIDVEKKKEIHLDLPTHTHINSVTISWSENPGEAYASYSERGYQKEFVKHLKLTDANITTLIEEVSETNIDNFTYRPLDSLGILLFLSERSGWRQLYVLDIQTKSIVKLSDGDYYVHNIRNVDEKKKVVYFTAAGREEGMNPYHQMLYSVKLNGDNLTLLTPERLNHEVSFSQNGEYFTDIISSVDSPSQTVLRKSETGEIMTHLTEANFQFASSKGWKAPETFKFTAKDGLTTLYGALWKPTNFDPTKKYPIIDHSYTGPHTQVYPRSFSRAFINQALAELGFVVMMVDGLGTSGRSKAFHNHSYKNMGNNLEDHVLAIQHLGTTRPWVDADKVGIFGHSAGGYDAGHAMLAFPEVYKVGVASSADHDFRMEKAWWPEMYMGWPVDSMYHEVSNITLAENLKGKLLITHGALDDNVNPSATFKLAEALIQADKEFDLLIFPSQRHGYRGRSYNYFLKK